MIPPERKELSEMNGNSEKIGGNLLKERKEIVRYSEITSI